MLANLMMFYELVRRVYLAPQNIPSAIVSILGNKVILYSIKKHKPPDSTVELTYTWHQSCSMQSLVHFGHKGQQAGFQMRFATIKSFCF